MRISDWSSDVCSSDLVAAVRGADAIGIVGSRLRIVRAGRTDRRRGADRERRIQVAETGPRPRLREGEAKLQLGRQAQARADVGQEVGRSEEHTSELVTNAHIVCRLLLEKKKKNKITITTSIHDNRNRNRIN